MIQDSFSREKEVLNFSQGSNFIRISLAENIKLEMQL